MALKKERKEIFSENSTLKGFSFSDLVVPILSLGVFALLTIFVYIPRILEGLQLQSEIKDATEKQTQLDTTIALMQPFVADRFTINADLKTAKDIVPDQLDVADFTFYVDQLAQSNRLVFKEISSSNINVNTVGSSNNTLSADVKGVNGPMVYEGNYADIVDFLDKLQKESPYIIETSTVFMRSITQENTASSNDGALSRWRIELTITGYYIQTPQSVSTNIYQTFIPYNTSSDVIDVFKSKASKLIPEDNTTNPSTAPGGTTPSNGSGDGTTPPDTETPPTTPQ